MDAGALLLRCEALLAEHRGPLTVARLRHLDAELRSVSEEKLTELLKQAALSPQSRLVYVAHGDFLGFTISSVSLASDPLLDGERKLYIPFQRYLEKQGQRAIALDHTLAGAAKTDGTWTHPDLVSVNESGLITGYEVKLRLSRSEYRLAFFECLANSIWANDRYVVAPDPDTEAVAGFARLAKRMPVGLIGLTVDQPDSLMPLVEKMQILVPCQRRELDRETLEELTERWAQLRTFLVQCGLSDATWTSQQSSRSISSS
ncbi:MAG: hypothetical protein HS115_16990 [Spirochaetales bacterium]|nr:hypothetical protein [Spirochaetales bacterium]